MSPIHHIHIQILFLVFDRLKKKNNKNTLNAQASYQQFRNKYIYTR